MPAFRFFDPYTALAGADNRPKEPAKAAKVAKADPVPPATLADLATLAGADAVIPAPPVADGGAAAWAEAEEERAAIVEFDGNIPRQWSDGFARLDPERPPAGVSLERWQRFVDDVGLFLEGPFCAVAAALGWGPYDLFGHDPERPLACLDMMGLLWLMNGAKLVALTEETATVEFPTGSRQTYHRHPIAAGTVLVWELVHPPDGRAKFTMRSGASPSTPAPPGGSVISEPAIVGTRKRVGYSDCPSAANE